MRFDVAILGGGMAGNLLARQLARHVPQARVLLVEKAQTRARKVGESTVDVCGKYLTKRLSLSTYLYDQHLPKNGLRFFFDREDRGGALEELSEIGSTAMLPLPSFQLDRARFEEDLLAMNAADGVDVRLGYKVTGATTEADGAHRIELVGAEDRRTHVEARWLVDATGRASLVARARGLRTAEGVKRAAVWGRFGDVVDLDAYGSEAFRGRVRHTARVLSTNHFCYPGYWIWLIPLGHGVTSVGVVMDRPRFDDRLRSREGFVAFLERHAAIRELLAPAELEDVGSLGQLAYGTTRFVDARERWALVGEAAAFTDPLYSPGGDAIALANDWVTDLIRRDLEGEPSPALAERGDLYDRLFALRHRATIELHRDQYDLLGSLGVFASKWDLDLACYLNLWVEPYYLDRHLDLDAVRTDLAGADQTLGVLDTFRHVFTGAAAALRSQDRYFARNLGEAVLDPAARFLAPDFATEASHRRALPRVRDAMQLVLDELNDALGRPRAPEPVAFARLALGRPLDRW
ncbi:MAG: NAD(P)/FAD-dependent oxidoreductase [Sandaracinaceae bacterium]|nr:NAD(P)/FAD-dependent oxidoreductase [Sandaracinaceae bacterium]